MCKPYQASRQRMLAVPIAPLEDRYGLPSFTGWATAFRTATRATLKAAVNLLRPGTADRCRTWPLNMSTDHTRLCLVVPRHPQYRPCYHRCAVQSHQKNIQKKSYTVPPLPRPLAAVCLQAHVVTSTTIKSIVHRDRTRRAIPLYKHWPARESWFSAFSPPHLWEAWLTPNNYTPFFETRRVKKIVYC